MEKYFQMLKLNENEWQIVLNTYLYEVEDVAIMSDSCFDSLCEQVARQKSVNIPGFDRSTGQFIYDLIKKYPKIKVYAKNLQQMGEGTAIIHVVPLKYIRPFH